MMWYTIFKFEINYRIKRLETYIFFVFLFLFAIVGVDFVFQGANFTVVKKNAPLILAKTMGAITGLFMILASMIMGVPIIRDFKYNIESLMFVNPIKKRDYLLGRFLGSFAVLLFVFSGMLFGMILSEFMPWQDPVNFNSFEVLSYVQPFVFITLPALFFGACLFFVTGALTRNLVVVYTQGIILFVVFLLTKAISNDFAQSLLDPFSLTTLTLYTDTWSMAERNLRNIQFDDVVLYNKLFWMLLGVVVLLYGYHKFNFNTVKSGRVKKQQFLDTPTEYDYQQKLPAFKLHYGLKAKWTQLKHLTWFYFVSVCKQPSFWAIMICGMIIILINSVNLGTVYGVDSFPTTYFIVEELQETSSYFFIIILVFYSGELIWKEREAHLDLIYDATPMSNFINIAGKYLGLLGIYLILIGSLIISGIIFQTMNGYYNYEFKVYFFGFFLEILPFLALFTFIAFFFQVITNNKFVGILGVIIFFILNIAISLFGLDHDLYVFAGSSLAKYSDMNGYGHFLMPYLLVKTYWFLFGILLLILISVISVRGTETNLIKRCKAARNRLSGPILKFGFMVTVLFILLGSFIFYNTNILNEHWTNSEATTFRAAYETALKQFEYLPQPKIVDVNLKVELYPKSRDYTVDGRYMLTNTTTTPITEIHIQKLMESNVVLDAVTFEGGAKANTQYEQYAYTIYTLHEALNPGATIMMHFKQRYITDGFELGQSNTNIVNNGIFFNNKDFPTLGYNRKYELRDTNERADYNLPKRSIKARRDDPKELVNARSGSDSDGINFEIVIGTSKNQTAIAPGTLLKKWTKNNRNYFHYKMENQMIDFYSIVSAEYEVKKDTWTSTINSLVKPVALEIYYHKEHDSNLDRMMHAMKSSFEYFSTHFSPYQYEQMRIMEFPRYAEFAQSFPGTVPFSEAIGFVLDIDDEKDVDMAFYVTAHELAHQWFGMQVEAANVQGQLMLLETLSQYAAIMVLKQEYSEEKVQQFLEVQKERYIEGKRRGGLQEPSLALVENQDYIYYSKGAIAMVTLQKTIGEDKVNIALKRFLADWNTIDGKIKTRTKNYATSKELIGYFREVTPSDQQQIITNLFETVGALKIN